LIEPEATRPPSEAGVGGPDGAAGGPGSLPAGFGPAAGRAEQEDRPDDIVGGQPGRAAGSGSAFGALFRRSKASGGRSDVPPGTGGSEKGNDKADETDE
jgi:hypothetical protein